MNIRFWGTRGSLATPLTNAELTAKIETALKFAVRDGLDNENDIPEFIKSLPWYVRRTAGGDTTCVEIDVGGKLIILDAGTGIRHLGLHLLQQYPNQPIEAHILMSHTHWDHICGIPFFIPGFNPKNKLIVHGPHPHLEQRFQNQQSPEYFPVPLAPTFKFDQVNERDEFYIGDVRIETFPLNHPGESYGYRITYENKSVVFATDSEYKDLSADALRPFTDFFKDADLLIYDAQYTMLENVEKEDWGHSNVFSGIDMALQANVKNLVFTHHEPNYNDQKLYEILSKAKEYLEISRSHQKLRLFLASEGLRFIL